MKSTPSRNSSTSSTGTDDGDGRWVRGAGKNGRFRAACGRGASRGCLETTVCVLLQARRPLGPAVKTTFVCRCGRDVPRGLQKSRFRVAVEWARRPSGPAKPAVFALLRASAAWVLAKKAKSMRLNLSRSCSKKVCTPSIWDNVNGRVIKTRLAAALPN